MIADIGILIDGLGEVFALPAGFDVNLEALDQAAQAASQTMHDMETCKIDAIDGGAGQYGHEGLQQAFEHFCEKWQYGVEVLIEDGESISRALNGSVEAYLEAEESAERSMRAAGSGPDPGVEAADG